MGLTGRKRVRSFLEVQRWGVRASRLSPDWSCDRAALRALERNTLEAQPRRPGRRGLTPKLAAQLPGPPQNAAIPQAHGERMGMKGIPENQCFIRCWLVRFKIKQSFQLLEQSRGTGHKGSQRRTGHQHWHSEPVPGSPCGKGWARQALSRAGSMEEPRTCLPRRAHDRALPALAPRGRCGPARL